MIVNFKGATLVRPKLMQDGSKRLEVDFGERLNFADIDDLINKSLVISIVTEDQFNSANDNRHTSTN